MEVLIQNLKDNNLKVTPQRLIIYKYLANNFIHPSAETIYNGIRKDNPTISLATVYKTLNSLKDANLIQEINVGEDSFRYDVQIVPHSHIICTECHEIVDYFPNEEFKNISASSKDIIEKESGFKINYQQMYFYGTCSNCKKSLN